MFKLWALKEETTIFVEKMTLLLVDDKQPRSAQFLAAAFCNYYHPEVKPKIDLSEIDRIDSEHQELFFNMMLLRSYGFRGDSELSELYLLCKPYIDALRIESIQKTEK